MALISQDVVRRLTVVASDTGLTTLRQKLDAVDHAQDRVAVSSTRMGRATEEAQRRIAQITSQATGFGGGLLGAAAGRVGGDVLGLLGRIAPAAITAYGAFKLLNATIERGTELLQKYGLEGQRALYDEGRGDDLAKLLRFQGDKTSLADQRYAAELSGRLDEANRKIKDFLQVQLDLTGPALKLMNAWVVIAEKIATAATWLNRTSPGAMGGLADSVMRSIPGVTPAYLAGKYLYNQLPGNDTQVSADEAMRIARSRLGAGLAAGGMVGKDQNAGFYGRFNAITDKPEKEAEKVRTAWDRALDSVSRSTAIVEAQTRAVGAGVGAQARFRVEAELTEAALRSKLDPASKQVTEEIERLGARAEAAATKLGVLRLQSDAAFERSQIGRTDTEAGIASRLRGVYGDAYESQMGGPLAAQMRLNEQLRLGKDLATDFASGFARDMMRGASATDALTNAVARLGDRLLDIALNKAISSMFGGINLGGLGGGSGVVPGTEAMPGLMFHSGGIVGMGGTPRWVHPAYFENAPRYHRGGVAGLAPDEVPAILQRGEHVIPRGGAMAAPKITVQLIEAPGRGGEVGEPKSDGQGGFNLEVMVDRITAKNIARPGTQTSDTLRAGGVRQGLARR